MSLRFAPSQSAHSPKMSRIWCGGRSSVLMIPFILAAAVALFVLQAAQITTWTTWTMQTPNGPSRSTMTKQHVDLEKEMAAAAEMAGTNGDVDNADSDKATSPASTTTNTTTATNVPNQTVVVGAQPAKSVDSSSSGLAIQAASDTAVTTTTTASSTSIATIGYLPLLPWEAESMNASRTCSVPYQSENPASLDYPTPLTSCCIGSYSAGGRIRYAPNVCNWTVDVYRRHEQLALEAWSRIPLVPATTNNSTVCDVCQIMNVLFDNNWTMAFLGDSVTGQSFAALECELRRRGYVVERQATDWRRPFMKGPWSFLQYGLNEVHEVHIQRPEETITGTTLTNTAILRYYRVYRPSANLTEVAELKAHNDILIFDHGLHYGPFDLREFDVAMTKLMGALSKRGNDSSKKDWKLLAWRETSAQHFVGHVGGHYMGEKSNNASTCVATTYRNTSDDDKLYFPRTAVMQRIMDRAKTAQHDNYNNSVNVRILPFWHYTQPMHELHPGDKDCAHYCYSPSFWLYLWRHLRNALDEAAVAADAAV